MRAVVPSQSALPTEAIHEKSIKSGLSIDEFVYFARPGAFKPVHGVLTSLLWLTSLIAQLATSVVRWLVSLNKLVID